VRVNTSDVILFSDIMVHEQYRAPALADPKIIVDGGANVGLASAYFLAKYPGAKIIAIEPDSTNVALCRRNLEPFAQRAVVLQAALWGAAEALEMSEENTGTWAARVDRRAERRGGHTIRGVTVPTLMAEQAIDVIDLLKIDIEGAETEVFSSADMTWLERVKCIQIELESEESRAVFFAALSRYPFRFSQHRETLSAVRVENQSER